LNRLAHELFLLIINRIEGCRCRRNVLHDVDSLYNLCQERNDDAEHQPVSSGRKALCGFGERERGKHRTNGWSRCAIKEKSFLSNCLFVCVTFQQQKRDYLLNCTRFIGKLHVILVLVSLYWYPC